MPPVYKYKEVEKCAQKLGWSLRRIKGSHHIYGLQTESGDRSVSIPIHHDDMPFGTFRSILDSLGITHEEFRTLMKKK